LSHINPLTQTLPANKATALCYTMKLEDFHSLFIGRMGPAGNEREVREIVRAMALILHEKYPTMIGSPESYLSSSNKDKYVPRADASTSLASAASNAVLGCTKATPAARLLFQSLGLSVGPDYVMLSEFASRITYLAFPKSPEQLHDSVAYLKKMAFEHNHLSVFAAVQVVMCVEGVRQVITLKELLQSLLAASPSKTLELVKTHFSLLMN
jgi:thymidylate synthase ThyX